MTGRRIDLGRASTVPRFTVPAPGFGFLHLLCSGRTESGKSSTVAALLGQLAGWSSIAFVGVDMKGGMELRPWAPRLTEFATTAEAAADLLGRLGELVDARAESATGRDWPADLLRVVLVVDELAELCDSRETIRSLGSIVAKGRAVGVHAVCSTQYALASDLSSTLLLNLGHRVCHRMGTPEQYATALALTTADLRSLGFEAIPEQRATRGVAYINRIDGMPDLERVRADLVTDETLAARVASTAHLRVDPETLWAPIEEPEGFCKPEGLEVEVEPVAAPEPVEALPVPAPTRFLPLAGTVVS
jgi:S-DNA-T family DNA segregation ATPase FtsK/SpoIIIE